MEGIKDSMNELKKVLTNATRIHNKNLKNKKTDMEKQVRIKREIYNERFANPAIFKIFGDYFELLSQDEKLSKQDGIEKVAFITGAELVNGNLRLQQNGITKVVLNIDDETIKNGDDNTKLQVMLHFDVYKDSRNVMNYFVVMTSSSETYIDSGWLYQRILDNAIKSSDIKGKQLEMVDDDLAWDVTDITKRSFDDIYLPNRIGNDLRLYKEVFNQQDHLMRYLMVGIPGTGKTESTLVLANEMINNGVTIIKTSICELFKEKIKLAELLEPSLIILDDIDLSLGSRNRGGISPLLRSFLDVLDGTEKISGNVGILATTNSLALLDIAARRPGRFDKTILFDGLTIGNIGDVIAKSLKMNFEVKEVPNVFVDETILKLYYDKNLTGSHIYNITELIFRRAMIEFKDITDITLEWILDSIKHEINVVDQVKKFDSEITDTFSKTQSGSMGFASFEDDYEDENEKYVTAEPEYPSLDEERRIRE